MFQGFPGTTGSTDFKGIDGKQRLIASNVVFLRGRESPSDTEQGLAGWRCPYCLPADRRHDTNGGGHSLRSKQEQFTHCCWCLSLENAQRESTS